MQKMTRRAALAAIPAMGAAAAVPAVAAPVRTPREQAIWHIRELERLLIENGGRKIVVMAQAVYGEGNSDIRTMCINIRGNFTDPDGMFDAQPNV